MSFVPGQVLTIVDVGGNQSGDCLLYNAHDTDERYSVPDTLAWQGNAYVRTGTVLRSNLGRALMTVVEQRDRPPGHHRRRVLARSRTRCATATT